MLGFLASHKFFLVLFTRSGRTNLLAFIIPMGVYTLKKIGTLVARMSEYHFLPNKKILPAILPAGFGKYAETLIGVDKREEGRTSGLVNLKTRDSPVIYVFS